MNSARPLIGLVILLMIGSCVSSDSSTGIDDATIPAGIVVQPAIIESPANASALPINQIRAVTARVPDNIVLGDTTITVDPNASEWDVTLDVVLTESPILA